MPRKRRVAKLAHRQLCWADCDISMELDFYVTWRPPANDSERAGSRWSSWEGYLADWRLVREEGLREWHERPPRWWPTPAPRWRSGRTRLSRPGMPIGSSTAGCSPHCFTGSTGIRWWTDPLALLDPHSFAGFLAALDAEGGDDGGLLLLDTLPRAIQGADENSPADMGAAMAAVDRIRTRGWGVLLLSHPAREGGDTPRGHSCQDGAMDALWVLREHDGGDRLLTCAKNKDGDDTARFALRLVSFSRETEGGQSHASLTEKRVLLLPPDQGRVSGSLTRQQVKVPEAVRATDAGPGVTSDVVVSTSGLLTLSGL